MVWWSLVKVHVCLVNFYPLKVCKEVLFQIWLVRMEEPGLTPPDAAQQLLFLVISILSASSLAKLTTKEPCSECIAAVNKLISLRYFWRNN